MDNKFKNLDKAFWDNLEEKYPGYILHFLEYVENLLARKGKDDELLKFTIEDFFNFSLPLQLGIFYDYMRAVGCYVEIDVCDYDAAIECIEEQFSAEKMHDIYEKNNY